MDLYGDCSYVKNFTNSFLRLKTVLRKNVGERDTLQEPKRQGVGEGLQFWNEMSWKYISK